VRRNWFIAAIVVGVGAIVVAALVMRLTEDDTAQPSATEWADSVCTSLATWRASITSLADVGAGTLTAESLREKLDEADAATRQLVTELRDLGAPDLESGNEAEQGLDAAAAEIQAGYEALKEDAEAAADASTRTEFLQELAGLAPQFQTLLDTLAATVENLQSGDFAQDARSELQQAFSGSASCQALQTES
jgi:hypothetical protein